MAAVRYTTGKASILIADKASGLCLSAASPAGPAVAVKCDPADPKQAWQLCKSRADCAPLHRELLKERQRRQTSQQPSKPPAPEACAQLFTEVATASSASVASALGYTDIAGAAAATEVKVCIYQQSDELSSCFPVTTLSRACLFEEIGVLATCLWIMTTPAAAR